MHTRLLTTLCLLFITFHLSAQQRVKTHEGVQIGRIKQWIGAVSKDDTKPLLLFLHGGPGFSSRAYSRKFIKYLKKDFIVAQWDQRGTGITKAWNGSDVPISLELMHSDTKEVVDYLLRRFDRKKLYLVGFSWGGFLGLEYARNYPERLHAYISVSAMIYGDASDRLTLELLKAKANKNQNIQATEELNRIHIPFASWEELYYLKKWTAYYSDEKVSVKTYPKSLFEEWSDKWMPIFQEAASTNVFETVPVLDCPIYFFNSKKDLSANYVIADNYFNELKADHKQFIWFFESTHEIPNQEPEKFAQELIEIANAEKM